MNNSKIKKVKNINNKSIKYKTVNFFCGKFENNIN